MIRGLFSANGGLILRTRRLRWKNRNDRVGWPLFAFVRLPLSPFGPACKLTDASTDTNARRLAGKLALLPSLNFAWLNTNLLTRGAFRRHVGATKFQPAPPSYLFSEIPYVKIFFMFFRRAWMQLFLPALLVTPLPSRVTAFIFRTLRDIQSDISV